MSDFNKRLNEFINRSGLTLDELSQKSGVKTKTIQNWTRKAAPTMPRLDQGVLAAQALGVSAEYLVTGNTPEGLSENGLKIALVAEQLSEEGKQVALTQVEALIAHFPLQAVQETAG